MAVLGSTQQSLVEARFAVARFGATRFNDVIPYLAVSIDGVDRSADVLEGSVSILDVTGTEDASASFQLIIGSAPPVEDSLVQISTGSLTRLEFGGQITRVTLDYRAEDLDNPVISIECTGWRKLLDRRFVNRVYAGQSATDVVRDIGTFTDGFDFREVEEGLPIIESLPLYDTYPSDALRQVATILGAGSDYIIRPNRRVAFWGVGGWSGRYAPTRPLSISADNLSALVPNQAVRDTTQRRTQVIVNAKRTTCLIGSPDGSTSLTIIANSSVDYLVVAGGGGGGALLNGGGGAGGVLQGADTIVAGSYAVAIGAGGATAANGSDSTYNGHDAVGGGHGSIAGIPANGGSGGGGSNTNAGGTGVAGQGNNGGTGDFTLSAAGGGGGGAGAPGGNAGPNAGGAGGAGVLSSISGTLTYYGGGGTGNGNSSSAGGGVGGGGGNSVGVGLPGTANTGGGGGAGSGGANGGGSGIVILSYPVSALSATGGTITTVGGRKIHTFTTSGTFVVSDVTLTAPPAIVTDIPVNDANQIDSAAGAVKIGSLTVDYSSLGGPTVASGQNPPGSTLSSDAAATDTVLNIVDSTQFTSSPGWAKAGDQIVRFTGVSAGQLTGIPAVGFGALAAAVKSGASVTWLGSLVFTSGVQFGPPLSVGDNVIQRVIVDDLTAQAALVAREGGDGVHQYLIEAQDVTRQGAVALASAYLSNFSGASPSSTWDTEDMNARAGSSQAFALDDFSVSLTIQRVTSTYDVPDKLPRRSVEAGVVKTPRLLDVIQVKR